MNDTYRLRINTTTGHADRIGVVTPTGTKVVAMSGAKPTVGGTIVLKIPGSRYWTGIGMAPRYAPAEFAVFKLVEVDESGGRYVTHRAEHLISFPVRGG